MLKMMMMMMALDIAIFSVSTLHSSIGLLNSGKKGKSTGKVLVVFCLQIGGWFLLT